MKATCFLRSSVMNIEAMMKSYFLASSPGMMPSQSWATTSHSTPIFAQSACPISTSKPVTLPEVS